MTPDQTIDNARMTHFAALDRQEQSEAIRRLAALGWTEHGISAACQLSVEMIRRILAEHHDDGKAGAA